MATSSARFFNEAMQRLARARAAGDARQVEHILAWVRAEGSAQLGTMAEQLVAAADDALDRMRTGAPAVPRDVGLNRPGETLICDFCGADPVAVYYPFHEFTIEGVTALGIATQESGDRMYACGICHDYVAADDWPGLRAWVGPTAKATAVRLLWHHFKANRNGDPVDVPPGTNPEIGRTTYGHGH